MIWRAIWMALGLSVAGCRLNLGPTWARFDDANGRIVFSPDGKTAAIPQQPRVSFYDLETKTVRWQHESARRHVHFVFSPRGQFVLVVESHEMPTETVLTLFRATDGTKVFSKVLGHGALPGARLLFVENAPRLFAISDDGALFACAYFKDLQIYSTATGKLVHQESLTWHVTAVAFQPGTQRLAFAADWDALRVVEPADGTWRKLATLDKGVNPAWSGSGLIFESPRGLESWDDSGSRLLLTAKQLSPGMAGSPLTGWTRWRVSPDGVHVAAWDMSRVTTWRLGAPEPAFVYQDEAPGAHELMTDAAFSAGRLMGFTQPGFLVALEVPSGRLVRRTSFGAQSTPSRALFTDGVTHSHHYAVSLAPNGRYLAIHPERGGAQVYRLE